MPTYEYHCPACKATYDLRQGFSAEVTHTCEECGKGTAKRVLHAPKVVFKGSGWYVTDSKSKTTVVADSADADAKPADAPAAKDAPPAAAAESTPVPAAADAPAAT